LKSSWLIVCLGVLCLPGCYLVKQGRGQLDLRFNQVPIAGAGEAESDPELRRLLADVPGIKAFAENRLLLKKSGSYTGYYKTPQEGVTFVVTASPLDELQPYTWWFPIVGAVPYKGFFNRLEAEALSTELMEKGFDTWLFPAAAYSTLGWFRDPVTTPMLRRGHYYLVSTIIHEMTHETLFVPGRVTFNEQLAVFVAETGAMAYFREIKGFNGEGMAKLQQAVDASNRFAATVRGYLPRFQTLYDSRLGYAETMKQRTELFAELEAELSTRFPGLGANRRGFNNARLLHYRRYAPDSPEISDIWSRSGGDWKIFWDHIRAYAAAMEGKKGSGGYQVAGVVEK